ncbi:hypothetical protein ACVWXN_007288 [Bradyrhizobium sp. i1.4.4]
MDIIVALLSAAANRALHHSAAASSICGNGVLELSELDIHISVYPERFSRIIVSHGPSRPPAKQGYKVVLRF